MIAVDSLGGDFAPHAVLQGVLQAAREGIPILLTGPESKITRYLSELDKNWSALAITICDAPASITMNEEPVLAVRRKPNSSLVKAVEAVKTGEALAVVSAGNSGALMAASLFAFGREDGIERPAIAGLLPTLKGDVIALDLGANVDCRPHYLYQFAHMGDAYARKLFNVRAPRVGLLSNGAEAGKGSELVKRAADLLEESSLTFVGNVEPIDVIHHRVDVVVCDGFSGNILLKTMEATAAMLKQAFAHEFGAGGIGREAVTNQLPQIEAVLQAIEARYGEGAHSGARLLGVNGVVIVAHGSAQGSAIYRCIKKAWRITQQ